MALVAGLLRSSGCSRVLLPHLLLFLHHRYPLVSYSRSRTTSSLSHFEPPPFTALVAGGFLLGSSRLVKNTVQSSAHTGRHTFRAYYIIRAESQGWSPAYGVLHAALLFSSCPSPGAHNSPFFGSLAARPFRLSGFSDCDTFSPAFVRSTAAPRVPRRAVWKSILSSCDCVAVPSWATLLSTKDNFSRCCFLISSSQEWGIGSLHSCQQLWSGFVSVRSSVCGVSSWPPPYVCSASEGSSMPISGTLASFQPSSVKTMSSSARSPSGGRGGRRGGKKPLSRTCSLPACHSSRVVYCSGGQASTEASASAVEGSVEDNAVTPTATGGVVAPHVDRGVVSSRSDAASFLQDPESTRTWLDVQQFQREVENARSSRGEANVKHEGSVLCSGVRSATSDSPQGRHESSPEGSNGLGTATSADHPPEWTMRVMTFNLLAESLTDYRYRSLVRRNDLPLFVFQLGSRPESTRSPSLWAEGDRSSWPGGTSVKDFICRQSPRIYSLLLLVGRWGSRETLHAGIPRAWYRYSVSVSRFIDMSNRTSLATSLLDRTDTSFAAVIPCPAG